MPFFDFSNDSTIAGIQIAIACIVGPLVIYGVAWVMGNLQDAVESIPDWVHTCFIAGFGVLIALSCVYGIGIYIYNTPGLHQVVIFCIVVPLACIAPALVMDKFEHKLPAGPKWFLISSVCSIVLGGLATLSFVYGIGMYIYNYE